MVHNGPLLHVGGETMNIEEALENFVYWVAEEDYIFKINEGDKNECIECI